MLLFIGVFTTVHALLEVRAKYVERTKHAPGFKKEEHVIAVMPRSKAEELIACDDRAQRAVIVNKASSIGSLYELKLKAAA